MVICYIGIGSNLGDRKFYIESAIKKIRILPDTKVKKVSSVIESAPQGGPAQGPYLNAVLEIETGLSPYQLLRELQQIESGLGRVRVVVNGPRTIDLDILLFGDICMNEEALCIPHPRMLERDFVMLPLGEIAPEVVKKLRKKAVKRGTKDVGRRTREVKRRTKDVGRQTRDVKRETRSVRSKSVKAKAVKRKTKDVGRGT